MKPIFLAVIFALFITSVFAQEDTVEQIIPSHTAYLFDQYNPSEISVESEKQKIELFVLQIKNSKTYAQGYIYVYRGISDYKFNAEERSNSINKVLTLNLENNSLESYRAFTRFGGFREESVIELIIKPSISESVSASPTASLFDVKYYDDATLPKGTIQKTGKQLSDIVTKKVEPLRPAAAKAVRAFGEVGVLIKIDEKGNVIDSKTILGHPLLRNACSVATTHWQFKPQKQNNVPVKVTGIVVCDFKLDE